MTTPLLRALLCIRPLFHRRFSIAVLAPALALPVLAAPAKWPAYTPEDLSSDKPAIEADAPAELLLWRIEINDKDYPRDRKTTEFRRYKVYDPEKAEDLLRISRFALTVDGLKYSTVDLQARVIQPNGAVKELGKESILERPVARTRTRTTDYDAFGTDFEQKEKYLAIAGLERGAIVDVLITEKDNYSARVTREILQIKNVPIRQLEYTFRHGDPDMYEFRTSVLNAQNAKLNEDKKARVNTLAATNLPGLAEEPYSGSISDYALTALSSYLPYQMMAWTHGAGDSHRTIDPKAGPWAVFASIRRWVEEDLSEPTAKVKKTAVALVEGAKNDVEKAQRIHNRVRDTYQDWRRRAKKLPRSATAAASMDSALELGKDPHPNLTANDFLMLALAMYRSAGLSAELILLPDRSFARLDPKLPSQAFLREDCIAIKIGEQWHFSDPTQQTPLPFDVLRWRNQGNGGLLARANKQDFIDVPLSPAEKSTIVQLGAFNIEPDGTLVGEFRRTVTGQHAVELRDDLFRQDTQKREVELKEIYEKEMPGAELTVAKVANIENADLPIEVTYQIRWPGYAVLTADRLILRANAFRAQRVSPFTASERRNRIFLPFRWQELDRVMLRLPPGFEPESMVAPASHPGDVLHYKVAYSYEAPKRVVHVRREFSTSAISVPVKAYADLKQWHDAATESDHHELVFLRKSDEAPAAAEPGAATATPPSSTP